MSELNVRNIEKEEFEEWDTLVERSPQGTIFHKTSWLTSFDDYRYTIVVCTHKKKIIAGIPLTYIKKYRIKFAVNPPFTPYLGIIFEQNNQKYTKRVSLEKEISKILANKAKNFAPYMEYSFHYNFLDAQPFIWTGFSIRPHYTYILNLEENLDTILENMEKDTRNRIVKALKYNLEFSDASPNEMAELIYLTYKRKNQRPPYSKRVYERHFNIFSKKEAVKSMIVKYKDEIDVGGAIVYDSKRAYYTFGGINPESKYKGIGQLVIWNLIKYSKDILGLKEFDFEGSMNESIELFFRGFGGKLTPCYTIYKSNAAYYLTRAMLKLRSKIT